MKTKTIAILQSNYIPWKGYFDLIHFSDVLILFDDAQYTKNDWRNRNKIKTQQGVQWLTIPVFQTSLHQKIKDTQVASRNWNKKHWQTIQTNYAQSTYFQFYKDFFEELYLNCSTSYLSEINYRFIMGIHHLLQISTSIVWSSNFDFLADKNERLIHWIRQLNGTHYLSGKAAQNYLDVDLFKQNGIEILWMDYENYPEYQQLFPPFVHEVSILDLLLNEGENAKKYMRSFT